MRVARIAAFVIGGIAIVLAIPAQKLNIAFLVALAFAVAASANLPSIIYNMFWRRFNTRGATWSIYGGLISAVGLVVFSPVMSGLPTACSPTSTSLVFPLNNPGIVSIPLGFLFGCLGTITAASRRPRTASPSSRSAPSPAPARRRQPALTRRSDPSGPSGHRGRRTVGRLHRRLTPSSFTIASTTTTTDSNHRRCHGRRDPRRT